MSEFDGKLMRRTALVAGGRILLLGLWFVAITLVYREIGKLDDGLTQAGVLAFSLAAIKMFTTALGDPLDLDVVRRVPPLLGAGDQAPVDIWRAAQQARMGLALAIVALAGVFAQPIAMHMLGDPGWSAAVFLAAVASAMELLYRGYLCDYQARERFGVFLSLEAGLQGARILFVAFLYFTGQLTAMTFLAVYGASAAILVLVGFAISQRSQKALWRFRPGVSLETWRYTRWVAPAMIVAAIAERLDIFLLSSISGPSESGLYGAMLPIILVPEVAIGFAAAVLQPRVADLREKGNLGRFWMDICKFTVPLAIAGAAFIWVFADQVITYSIGPAYLDGAIVLRILFTGVMAWFSVVPIALVFVVMSMPRGTLLITLTQAAFVVILGMVLIPNYGAVGAASTILLMKAVTGAAICVIAFRLLNRRSAVAAEVPE